MSTLLCSLQVGCYCGCNWPWQPLCFACRSTHGIFLLSRLFCLLYRWFGSLPFEFVSWNTKIEVPLIYVAAMVVNSQVEDVSNITFHVCFAQHCSIDALLDQDVEGGKDFRIDPAILQSWIQGPSDRRLLCVGGIRMGRHWLLELFGWKSHWKFPREGRLGFEGHLSGACRALSVRSGTCTNYLASLLKNLFIES